MFTSLDAVETDLRTVIGGPYRLFPIMSYEEARSTTAVHSSNKACATLTEQTKGKEQGKDGVRGIEDPIET